MVDFISTRTINLEVEDVNLFMPLSKAWLFTVLFFFHETQQLLNNLTWRLSIPSCAHNGQGTYEVEIHIHLRPCE